jgi:hypothetical protein
VSPPRTGPPRVALIAPTWASSNSTRAQEQLAWHGTAGSAPIAYYSVSYRRTGSQAWHWLLRHTSRTHASLRGPAGSTYVLHAVAVDTAGKRSALARSAVAIPLDDRDRRINRSRHGWRELRRAGAYGGTLAVGVSGATISLRFFGHVVAIIGPRLRHAGVMLVTLDGLHPQRIGESGRAAMRLVLSARQVRQRNHVLRIRVLSGTVEIDAIGVRRSDRFGG